MSGSRQKVLRLYRQVLSLGKTWKAKNPSDTAKERQYIVDEARRMFKSHLNVKDSEAISSYIREAESRIELALHYQTPYPRPTNLPPMAMAKKKGKEQGRFQERIKRQSTPVYIKSQFD